MRNIYLPRICRLVWDRFLRNFGNLRILERRGGQFIFLGGPDSHWPLLAYVSGLE